MLTVDEAVVLKELEKAGRRVLDQTGYQPKIAWPVIN